MANIIVSGCPRSGTSMTMRILANANLDIATDNKRIADKDNLHGYYEVESIVNKIKDNPGVVFNYDGQVLKVIHFGIQYLPKGSYKIIYIERNIDEVLDSMEKMMGKEDPERENTKRVFLSFNDKTKKIMKERDDIDYIIINHRDLVTDPEPTIDKIIHFLGISLSKKEDMLKAIDNRSYRNKH
jgi:hypothetical protein